jgi:mycothiol synthase
MAGCQPLALADRVVVSERFVPLVPFPELAVGYARRAPVESDAPALVELFNALELTISGTAVMTAAEFLGDWEGIELARDAVTIVAPDGCPAAYADVSIRGDVLYSIYGYVHPNHHGRGLGRYLVAWGETRARLGAALPPESARIVTRHYVNELNPSALELLRSLGYQPVRVTYTMEANLTGLPPAPAWPDGLIVRRFVPGQDDVAAYEAYEEAFADMWQRPGGTLDDFQSKLRRPYFDPFHWFLVMDGNEVAGTLFSDNIEGSGWVEIVGVRRPWRGRGVGLAMLRQALGAFYERGVTKVGLSVDAQSPTGAPRVYQRAGFQLNGSYQVLERELRPGNEPDNLART